MNERLHIKIGSVVLGALGLAALFLLLDLPNAAADFSLKDWQRVKSITLPTGFTDDGLVELVPDPEVYDRARLGLIDLRIIDGEDREVPYHLGVERGARERRSFPVSVRDIGFVPGQHSSFVADLGQEGTLHNEIEVSTTSQNFEREVTVEGSNDASTWAVLQERTKIFDFTLKERGFTARDTRVRYPESTLRYLRVRIMNDGEEPLEISGASVFSVTEKQAQETAYPATISNRTEDSEKRTSLIVFDLRVSGLPTNRLTIDTPQVNFYREITLEGTGDAPLEDATNWSLVQRSGALYSYDTPKFVGDKLALEYPETTFRFFRLTISNEDNPPLPIEGVEVYGVSRRLIFQAEPQASYKLYYGNPSARAPSYELERILPFLDTEDLPTGALGPQTDNQAFEIEKKRLPFSERFPWLFPTVVALAAVVVAFLLFGVVRKAKKVLPPPE